MCSYSCCLLSGREMKQTKSLSYLLKLISEESRLKILYVLRGGKHCVCEIVECLNMSQSLISHHLKDLKDMGVVADEKKGLRVYYSLTEKGRKVTNLIFRIPKEVKL